MDTALLLLLVGISGSVNLGEVSPGFVTQAIVQGRHLEAQTTFDTTDKFDATRQGGWRASQSLDAILGPGVIVGAEYAYRRGGYWTKQFAWVQAGYRWQGPKQTVRLTGRATVWSYLTWAKGQRRDIAERGVEVEYRRVEGRWAFATTHGLVAYEQVGWHLAYAMTATVGVALF